MRVFLMALMVMVSVGAVSAFASNTCIMDGADNCMYDRSECVTGDGVVRLGIAGSDQSILSGLVNSYRLKESGKVDIIKPYRQNAVQENRTVGRPYDVLVSYNKGEIKDELMENGFADWVIRIDGKRKNCEFISMTIPYQNNNRDEAVQFISYVLEQQKANCLADIVFEGNIEKLDPSLIGYIQAVAVK